MDIQGPHGETFLLDQSNGATNVVDLQELTVENVEAVSCIYLFV